MFNDLSLSDWKFVYEEAKKMILAAKKQECQAKDQGDVTVEVEKEELEAEIFPIPHMKNSGRYLVFKTSVCTTVMEMMSLILIFDK